MIQLPRRMNPFDGAAVEISEDTRIPTFHDCSSYSFYPEVGQEREASAVDSCFLRANYTTNEGAKGGVKLSLLDLNDRNVRRHGFVASLHGRLLFAAMFLLFCLLGLALFTNDAIVQATPTHPSYGGGRTPTVKVANGTLKGRYSSEYNQDFFLGVPFAQPPVGELRFRIPQSVNTSYDGEYDASEYSPAVGSGSPSTISREN